MGSTIHTLLFIVQILVTVALIGFILIQHGKGADAGAAFGSGSSSTVFGSQGAGSFLTKMTTLLAIIFLGNSLLLAYLATQNIKQVPTSLLDDPVTINEQEKKDKERSENQFTDTAQKQNGEIGSSLPSMPKE